MKLKLTGDEDMPDMAMKESEVKHLRRLLAWLRCEYTLDTAVLRGYLKGAPEAVRLGTNTEEQASKIVQEKVDQIDQCLAYVRQSVKMLTRALRYYEHTSLERVSAAIKVAGEWRVKPKPAADRYQVVECPVCKGRLHLSQSAYNGHVHSKCETRGCLSWTE